MKVELLSYNPDVEKLVAAAAKLCYSPSTIENIMDGLDEKKTASFVEMLSEIGHESPVEHATFTFGIEGVSRVLLAQITRHRIASFSVQSQRYVSEKQFDYIIPPQIEAIPEAKAEFLFAMKQGQLHYDNLACILKQHHYEKLLQEGKDEKTAKSAAEKAANEDARFVLPNACDTKLILTINCRSLLNFFSQRCCNRAQWEIHALADEMLKLVYRVAPHLFAQAGPSCIKGSCPEGKMTCGKSKEVKEYYGILLNSKL
jgi:thymidylate synthase (FAD)